MRLRKLTINILIFFLGFISIAISIQAKEHKVVKVGYTSSKGYMEKNGELYTGYLYDYLREISIYTNWEYEFIEMDLSTALDALKDGEIDLMGAMIKNQGTEQLFDFPKYDMGYTYNILMTSNDSQWNNELDYVVLDGIKVGYLETAQSTANNFVDFCEENGIGNVVLVPFDKEVGERGLEEKLKDQEVEAIIGGDLTLNECEGKVVARFGANPYYFATTKGNTEIVKGLNQALFKIEESNSAFEQSLYYKYFRSHDEPVLFLSEEEEAYIKNKGSLRIGYLTNYMPIQYYNKKTKSPDGILIEYMKSVAEKLNTSVEFVPVIDYEQGYELIKSREVDLLLGVLDDYLIADEEDIYLTKSIIKLDVQEIANKRIQFGSSKNQNQKIVAMSSVYADALAKDIENQLKYYDTIEEAIEAVNRGEVSCTYVSNYVANYYMARDIYEDVIVYPSGYQISLALGVHQDYDEVLWSILTKAISFFPDEELKYIVNSSVAEIYGQVNLIQYIKMHLEVFSTIAFIILAIITLAITRLVKKKIKKLKEVKKVLFQKTQLDGLTGIYNREACERLVGEYLENKNPLMYGVLIIIDMDYFKQVNDRFGHKMGDDLLVEFGSILNQFFAHKDIVARLGGDEFIVFMTDINEQDLTMIHEKLSELCQLMNREVKCKKESQTISLSIGAVITQENIAFSQLYTLADEMLYEVKRNGRNGFKIKDQG